jgi:hypothetical protein
MMLQDLQFRIKLYKPLLQIIYLSSNSYNLHYKLDMEIQHTENY